MHFARGLMAVIVPIGTTALTVNSAHAQDCVWGSFDSTRVNYPAGTLNGDAHLTLQNVITSSGGAIAPGTPMLTAEYLSDKKVFYTSLLSEFDGALSTAEQTVLQNWIADGGTLIVTVDYDFPPHVYGSFTDAYGVTNYTDLVHQGFGQPVASHPITDGVKNYRYAAEVTFTYGPDALLLGDNGLGDDFMVVLEPETGFEGEGRILVLGDHNLFNEGFIFEADNIQLATNIATWACGPPGPCLEMTLTNFVAGSTAQWDMTGGVDGHLVAVVWGLHAGMTTLNGEFGFCASFEIAGVNQNRLVGTAIVNGETATVMRRIPNGTSGLSILTQASMRGTCPEECMSEVITEVIQ